jgi:excisionase family DNA binding protein
VTRRPRPASVPGPLAWVIVAFLRRRNEFPDWLPGVLANLSADERAVIREYLPDLELTADQYKAWRASDLGTSELSASVPAAPLPHEISAREAASMIGVSDRRVRQLLAEGSLDGRRDGWSWLVDRSSVELYRRNGVA